jgi:archaeosine-15-forming tRNA-guanine transglycosylase
MDVVAFVAEIAVSILGKALIKFLPKKSVNLRCQAVRNGGTKIFAVRPPGFLTLTSKNSTRIRKIYFGRHLLFLNDL